ncbi:cytochrome c oxidase subunit II [Nitrosococcus wardiae]|uniref:cytochrome c oxidase subunit II n=1 Tax=Nitrosococcus wardiae TaxID=1814290 RepID=UPI001F0F40C8|nr:cytochrome c oxidase subunit II [Nitrosococcus wardiae]
MGRWLLLPLWGQLAGCRGIQSALAPSGTAAREIAALWWSMAVGAFIIYVIVLGIAFYAVRIRPERHGSPAGYGLILGGGVALPLVVLSTLLTYSFSLGPTLRQPVASGALQIEVIGKQWWWEIRYLPPGQKQPIVSANEVHIPIGEPVEILLKSADVIHSFWVPPLAGKIDMVPGRTNRLVLQADQPGTYRGQCAEYCGGPHALMAFYVIAETPKNFALWLEQEAQPVKDRGSPLLMRGQRLFINSGCGTCHTVRGTPAGGRFGPDLTHVGRRYSLAAGILPNNIGTLAGWVAGNQILKPGNKMPSFNTFEGEALRTLAAYLESLQ